MTLQDHCTPLMHSQHHPFAYMAVAALFFCSRSSSPQDPLQQPVSPAAPAAALLGSPAPSDASNATPGGERRPEDISKDELLTLCMKLSKRLKVVETRATQLTEVHKQVRGMPRC